MSAKLYALFRTFRGHLTVPQSGRSKPEPLLKLGRAQIEPYLPIYWREEAKSEEEWFIRLARSLGFHVTWVDARNQFDIRLVNDEADEATITWPGRDARTAGHAKAWSHD